MPLHNIARTPVTRLPDLDHQPEFSSPWVLACRDSDRPFWWRIDDAGTIYHLDLTTNDLRSY